MASAVRRRSPEYAKRSPSGALSRSVSGTPKRSNPNVSKMLQFDVRGQDPDATEELEYVVKAIKALKRLEKAEALMAGVIERYAVSDDSVQQVLRAAKTSLVRARQVVKAQSAASKKTAPVKRAAKKAIAHKPAAERAVAHDGAGKDGARRAASKAQSNGSKAPQQAMAAAG